MSTPRWKKVFADLWNNRVRTLLVVLSIAVGVFAVGFVASTYLVLQKDVPADFTAASPHAAVLYIDPFDEELLSTVRHTPGIGVVTGRSTLNVKLENPDGSTIPMQITRIPELSTIQIDLLRLEHGSPQLNNHEIYLERQVASKLGYQVGNSVRILLNDGSHRDLRIAGTVQDVTGSSFLASSLATAFANANTIAWLDGPQQYMQLVFTVNQQQASESYVRQVAEAVIEQVKKSGRRVYNTSVNRPGEHPSQKTLNALLALLGGLGMLSLFLSAFLVVNTISALMGQQVRQIGVMKSIGASVGQVTGLYLVQVLAFSLLALLIAIPAAAAAAYRICQMLTNVINVNMSPFRVPAASILMQVVIGLAVPMLAALLPVIGGARLTVRQAITNYGLCAGGQRSWFDRLLETVRGLPRPLLLSLRNTFRRKARLALTLSTLTLGGAIFISIFAVRDSINLALEKTFGYTLADVNIGLSRPYRIERLREISAGIPGVVSMEGWTFEQAQVLRADSETGDDVQVIALPAGSRLIKPTVTSGRWLHPEDECGLVVGNHYTKIRPETTVGDTVAIRIGDNDYNFIIIGIYEMAGNPATPMVFTNYEAMAERTGKLGQVSSLRFVTDRPDPARQAEVKKALETRFREEGIQVIAQTGSETSAQQSVLVRPLVLMLLAMALLIALVGILSLMGTMSMNVLERTREIGVMRSIGAMNGAIFQLVVSEGILIGLISWGLGALLSAPIARLLDIAVGVALLNVPLQYIYSLEGLIIWLVIVSFLSTLASLIPAASATRLTIRDIIAYE